MLPHRMPWRHPDRIADILGRGAAAWRDMDKTGDGFVAVSGIGEAALRITAGAGEPLSLRLLDESLSLSHHEAGRARAIHAASVSVDDASVAASLGAVAAAARGGAGHVAATVQLRLRATNEAAVSLSAPRLRLTWSAAMPRQPLCLLDPDGDPVAVRVADRRTASARFASSVTGPGVGDRKSGGTPAEACGDVPGHSLGAQGWVTPLASPDWSEGELTLGPLDPGGSVTLTWTIQVAASVDASRGAAAIALAALTGGAGRT